MHRRIAPIVPTSKTGFLNHEGNIGAVVDDDDDVVVTLHDFINDNISLGDHVVDDHGHVSKSSV